MDVIVVGAGITGVAAAEWLRRDGHDVTLIDRLAPGDAGQTSFGNAGILARAAVVPVATPGILSKLPRMALDPDKPLFLRLSYLPRLIPWAIPFLRNSTPARVAAIAEALAPLVTDSVEQHLALARGTPAAAMITQGPYLLLYRDREAYAADAASWALKRAHGIEWAEWDRAEIEAHDPAIAAEFRFAAAMPDHGWIASPARYVAALAAFFTEQGGHIREAEVVDIRPSESGGASVTLAGGEELSADRVVLAAGVWAGRLAARLGHKIAMEAERGYHVMLSNPSHLPPSPIMVEAAKTVATPMADGLRFAGVAEFAGIDGAEAEAPVALIRKQILQLFPGLTWEGETVWMGRRPTTADSLPLIGASPRAPGVIFAFGGQHLGLTMGPRLGRMAAGLASGGGSNLDLAPYRVDRFQRA
ncbi:FAD-binding oxidoreductase [Limibaculum sp. M0105]|uniref:FAD-binding oxidoreductase n=1 Tax=Thermohalobaculum xanthum TaxID=2753746 RepID=A0A8J7M5M2_9RHOB|nr:FAD-binding oxidoreductase [Thermohalobaculum xanthum]MBK0398884.1 FAD-binding oxidoreductase [Thermohalobaculum xanthum]